MYFSYPDCPYRFSCEGFLNGTTEGCNRFAENPSTPVQSQGPPGPPPNFTPLKATAKSFAFEGGPISFEPGHGLLSTCVYEFVYIWPKNAAPYWSWVNNVVYAQSVSGFKWTGSNWVNFSERMSNMEGFYCYNPFREPLY
jgi:hypothetical protein